MANKVLWSALGSFTTAIAGATTAPTLKNLAAGSLKLGNAVTPSPRDTLAVWDLYVRFAAAPVAGKLILVWFILSGDDTNYEDGSDSVTPQRLWDIAFPVRAVDTQQRITLSNVPFPATKFKPLLKNDTLQNFTNTDNENILSYRSFAAEVQ